MESTPEKSPGKKRSKRKQLQFGLGGLFFLMLAFVIGFTCIGGWAHEYRGRSTAANLINQFKGTLTPLASRSGGKGPTGKIRPHEKKSVQFETPIGDDELIRLAPFGQWLEDVEQLDLHDGPVTARGISALASWPSLEVIDLSGTQVDDAALEALGPHPHLFKLLLDGTPITDNGLTHLLRFPQLRSLSLNNTSLTATGLATLRRLKQLEELSLAGTKLGDSGMEHLMGLEDLQVLNLSSTAVTSSGLSPLKRLTKLRELNLSHTQVDAESIIIFRRLPSLEQINLLQTSFTPEDLSRLQRACPQLQIQSPPSSPNSPAPAANVTKNAKATN